MKVDIPTDGVLETLDKMLDKECLIILITCILFMPKEFPLKLIHHHITLLEFMELINIGLAVLWRKELLPKPLFKDLPGEISHIDPKPQTL